MICSRRELSSRASSLKNSRFYTGGSVPYAGYSDEFYTPASIVQALGEFDLDPCAGPLSKHARRNNRTRDGLKITWQGRVWLNPPYSSVHLWLAKFIAHGNGIVLINARCETGWFQRLVAGSSGLLIPRGRIDFARADGRRGRPPVGSALVAYGDANLDALRTCGLPGLLLVLGS